MKCKISVIIPVYNTEEYILRWLNSIVSQTFKDYEIIIIDDGSKDKSSDIIKEFIKSHQDIAVNYIYQENAGQAAARNEGLKHAEGEYICFIDSDDYVDDEMFEALYSEAINVSADIVVCDMKFAYDDGTTKYFKNISDLSQDNTRNYIISNAGPCAKIIKSDIIKENGLYFPQGIIYEDLAVVPAYGIYANKVAYVPKPYYNYFQRINSTMNQTSYNPKFENIFKALDNLKNEFVKSGKADMYKEELEYLYIEHLLRDTSFRILPYIDNPTVLDVSHKIVDTMKYNYPNYKKNIYFKNHKFKYRFVTNLLYQNKIKLLKYTAKGVK